MKKLLLRFGVLLLGLAGPILAQIPDGKNEFRLAAVNARRAGLDFNAGRGLWVADKPDLDGDGKPEILVTTYQDGGRIFVFEVTGDDKIEFVWASKALTPGRGGAGSTPRSVVTGDIDNNGRQEIIFNIGNAIADSLLRGIYIYEHNGVQGSDNYGTEPVIRIKPEQIDPRFSAGSVGTTESGWLTGDIDGDNRNELVWCPRSFATQDIANAYIIQVKSGEWRNQNAQWAVEYKYDGLARALPAGDGYTPVGVAIGDIDSDGKKELVITGWVFNVRGGGVGFVQVNGPDSYQPGSVVPLTEVSDGADRIFIVKAKPLIVRVNNADQLFIQRHYFDTQMPSDIIAIEGFADDAFIDASNIKVVLKNHPGAFSIWGAGDQDHGAGNDGFDFYLSSGTRLFDYEYKGTGSVLDSTNYTRKQIFDLTKIYTATGGLFNEFFVTPGMDLDGDGKREIVTSWKGADTDAIGSTSLATNSFNVFVFEWGDSTQSIDLKQLATGVESREWTVITPEDYDLAPNYPNPFNPSTTIEFTLPLNKLIGLRIYDSLGREIRTLIAPADYAAGKHAVVWDGKDNTGQPVASGQYIYRLEFGGFVKSKIMTLVK